MNIYGKRNLNSKAINTLIIVLLFFVFAFGCTSKGNEQTSKSSKIEAKNNILVNGGFEDWSNETRLISPKRNQVTVDLWMTFYDGEPVFSILKEEGANNVIVGKNSVKIVVDEKKNSSIIDFYQPIKNKELYKGKKVSFSANIRCSKPGACQVIMNDDTGTSASIPNKGTDWETLSSTKVVGSDIKYLNFAIRIKTGIQPIVYVDDCSVKLE